ncbi:MAG TPA: V-type ATP synthase subunit I [Methanomicrobiales archaeon]|jgi:V/A-type H+-transporting ATPase subunit I|nr:V-type ATP synthase subunit I [Methanomicrobiales archaeon]
MLKTKSMTHLLITGLKERMEPTIRELYLQYAFHVREYVEGKDPDYEGFVLGKPLSGAVSVSGELVRLRGVLSLLGIDPRQTSVQERPSAGEITGRIERDLPPLEKEVEDLVTRRRDALEPRIHGLEEEIAALAPFAAAPLDLDLYRGYTSIAVFAGRIGHDVNIPVPHEKFFTAAVEGNFLALFVRVEDRAEVEGILQGARFQPLAVPEGSGSPADRVAACRADLVSGKKEMEEIDRRLGEIRTRHEAFLFACEEILSTRAEQFEVPLRFATTEGAFVAEGWVPTERVRSFKEAVARAAGGKVYITEMEMSPETREVPVEYENPPFAQPTELITDLHSRPRYWEVDPTLTVAIIFPLFFGLILGDVGYGALLLAVSLALSRIITSKDGARMAIVLRNCSISAIIFGILFSEFFGFEMPWHPVLPSRHLLIGAVEAGGEGPNIVGLIVLAVWIAVAQITLGRILSAVNKSHDPHHGMKGVLGQAGWIATMFGILFLLWSIFPIPNMPDLTNLPPVFMGLSVSMIVGAVLTLGGILLIANESALELIELPTLISNTMSYARLAAVGLSSVVIAIVINYIAISKLIEPNLENLTILGIVLILVGIAVLVGGHLLNTALGLIGGGLQSLRLQYVEYFTKFYKGGGKKYRPFGKERRFTED